MKDVGEVSDILRRQVERNRAAKTIFLHQSRYAEAILDRFDMVNRNPISTPFNPSLTLSASHCATTPHDYGFMIGKNYRSVVGSFMYLAMGTRPDLACTLQQLSQFFHNPGPTHWSAVQRALRFLKGTRTYCISLGGIASVDV
ncbi:hypothetical protein AaE_005905, partial [Aphanomyces astaci]